MSNMPISNWNPILLRDTVRTPNDFIDGDWIESAYITDEGIRLIQTGNIGIGRFIERSDFRKYISFSSFRKLNCKWVYPGDILICRLADPIGRACIIPHEIGQCVTAVDCTIYRPNEKLINSSFAIQLFNFENHLRKVAFSAAGSTRQRISRTNLGKVILSLPSIEEQNSISAILDALDEAIIYTESIIAKLKHIKAGLLHDLLTCGVDENGELRDPMVHPEQFQETKIGSRPHNWDIIKLNSIAIVKGGKRLPNGHTYAENFTGYKYLRVLDFFERTINYQQLENLQYQTFIALSRYEISNGDVFLSIAGSLGFAGVCRPPLGERVILTENAARIIPNDDIVPEFLAIQINEYNVQCQIESEKGTGGGVPKLALFRIENLWVAKPHHEEQKIIVSIAAQQEEQIQREEAYLFKLRQIKQGLMQDLLTGSVRVNEIKLDLPEA